jgi:hypothetical protein
MSLVARFKIGILSNKTSGHFLLVGIIYCLVLLIPCMVFLLAQLFGALTTLQEENWILSPGLNLTEAAYRVIVRLSIFSAVIAFGALGAAVSVISRARSPIRRIEEISVFELLAIQTIGAIFALVLSLMFMGEMIAGSLFPTWNPFYRIIYSPAAFAKLLVWSFIAGFIERLVPTMLMNLAKHGGEAKSEGSLTDEKNERDKS